MLFIRRPFFPLMSYLILRTKVFFLASVVDNHEKESYRRQIKAYVIGISERPIFLNQIHHLTKEKFKTKGRLGLRPSP